MPPDWISPDWPAPSNVHAFMTTRSGGVSLGSFASFNPAGHVGDAADAVAENRRRLRLYLPAEPLWLNQVHGCAVACELSGGSSGDVPTADASAAFLSGEVRAVLTADCLPVLFCDAAGSRVAAAHAGWRGLAAGVLEETVRAMRVHPTQILAWLGAAIGPAAFAVGDEVREAFVARDPTAAAAFTPHPAPGHSQIVRQAAPGTTCPPWGAARTPFPGKGHSYLADLYALARNRLAVAGVTRVYGGGLCTFGDPRFFSYRREVRTGRMACVIWRD